MGLPQHKAECRRWSKSNVPLDQGKLKVYHFKKNYALLGVKLITNISHCQASSEPEWMYSIEFI